MAIHPSAIIAPYAEVDSSAEIGPFCVIHKGAHIGANTILMSHVVVHSYTYIGERNTIHPFASVGNIPQDLKFNNEKSQLIIGNENIIRENVTLNRGTLAGGMKTVIGNNCLLMAYSHVAHDCILGDNVILANCASLGGHVTLQDHVIAGGMSAVHQFCKVGKRAFLAGGAMVSHDILPFTVAKGDRATHAGLNITGLKRAKWNKERIQKLRIGYNTLFCPSDTFQNNLLKLEQNLMDQSNDIKDIYHFISTSKRGISRATKLSNP